MRPFAALTVTLLIVSAGCLSPDDERPDPARDDPARGADPGAEHDEHVDGSNAAPPPAAGPPRTDQPPVAAMSGTNTSGDVPLQVVFHIVAEDPDGDEVTWLLDADGDRVIDAEGSTSPMDVPFTIWDPGNHTATLYVRAGPLETTADVKIEATSPPPPALPDPLVFEGIVSGAWIGADGAGGPAYVGTARSHTFNFTASIAAVGRVIIGVTAENATALDLDLELLAPDGQLVARAADDNVTTLVVDGTIVVEDPDLIALPGEWRLTVRAGLSANGAYRATVMFE